MPRAGKEEPPAPMPNITHEGTSHFISGISDGVTVGYKYFAFDGETILRITLRGQGVGTLSILLGDEPQGTATITPNTDWHSVSLSLNACGTHALYLKYRGEGSIDIREYFFE